MGTRDQVSQWGGARRLVVASAALMLFVPIMVVGLGVGQGGAATGNPYGVVYESDGTTLAANAQLSAGGSGGCCQSTNTNSERRLCLHARPRQRDLEHHRQPAGG